MEDFKTLREVEKEHIYKALELSGGNKAKAARLLGLNYLTVLKRLDKYHQQTLEKIKNDSDESEGA